MNAVIYCRVSSRDQVEGTSLESQEAACRDYARRHNLEVVRVFREEGESAKFADRTQLLELLNYCKRESRTVEVLLVWKIDRFARNVEDHYTIKAALRKLGVRIVSVTEPIEADPNGKLMETILAGFAQFDNDIRSLRSIQGMQQRLKEGIWPWAPPIGYVPPKIGKKTRPDGPDPQRFEAIREAWRLFASGAYRKAEILRLLHSWGVVRPGGGVLRAQGLDHMFANPFYAGILRDPWTGTEYPGRHVAMVTEAEFVKVQELVSGHSNKQPHHRLSEHFALKGLVRCPSCGELMTAYFATGKRERYPYYKCFRRVCLTRTRSYGARLVHGEFVKELAAASLPPHLAGEFVAEIVCAHAENTEHARLRASYRSQETERLKQQLEELVSMRAAKLVSNDEFLRQRDRIKRQLADRHLTEAEDERFTEDDARMTREVLADLGGAWQIASAAERYGLGGLFLPSGYVYGRIRTTQKGLLFKTLEASKGGLSHGVPLIRASLNALLGEIHKLVTLVRQSQESRNEAL